MRLNAATAGAVSVEPLRVEGQLACVAPAVRGGRGGEGDDAGRAGAYRATQRPTATGVDSIRPRVTSPVSVSNASKVICARCTIKPGYDRHQGLL